MPAVGSSGCQPRSRWVGAARGQGARLVWEKDSSSLSGLCRHLAGHRARGRAIHRRTLPEVCQKFPIPGSAVRSEGRARGQGKDFGVSSQVSPQGAQSNSQTMGQTGTDFKGPRPTGQNSHGGVTLPASQSVGAAPGSDAVRRVTQQEGWVRGSAGPEGPVGRDGNQRSQGLSPPCLHPRCLERLPGPRAGTVPPGPTSVPSSSQPSYRDDRERCLTVPVPWERACSNLHPGSSVTLSPRREPGAGRPQEREPKSCARRTLITLLPPAQGERSASRTVCSGRRNATSRLCPQRAEKWG